MCESVREQTEPGLLKALSSDMLVITVYSSQHKVSFIRGWEGMG